MHLYNYHYSQWLLSLLRLVLVKNGTRPAMCIAYSVYIARSQVCGTINNSIYKSAAWLVECLHRMR